jgi:cytochrome c553
MRRWVRRAVRLVPIALGLGLLGFLLVVSGVVPIKASSGHWPITAWLLDFAKKRSVATHSLGLRAPALDDPSLVMKGAAHFDVGCRPCHGGPNLRLLPRIPWRMTPFPPDLASTSREYDPEDLFYIVKHGVKFTGMPAWPVSDRDDEVWAVVAFLQVLPELGGDSYRHLARGDAAPAAENGEAETLEDLVPPEAPPLAVVESCARCHGVEGGGRGVGAFPRIDGQRPEYLYRALRAYADQRRPSGIMGPIAAGLDATAWRELADYYAARNDARARRATVAAFDGGAGEGTIHAAAPEAEIVAARERGAAIAKNGVPERAVASCEDCHGPHVERNPAYPELAGQYAEYLELQLRLFSEGRRGGSPYARLMASVAPRLSPEQMRDVALYYASLPPE